MSFEALLVGIVFFFLKYLIYCELSSFVAKNCNLLIMRIFFTGVERIVYICACLLSRDSFMANLKYFFSDVLGN